VNWTRSLAVASVGMIVAAVTAASDAPPSVAASPALTSARASPSASATVGRRAGRYRAPVNGPLRVLRRFQPPPTPYAAGHRGVDLATVPGQVVLAASGGQVTFAGDVAGRGVVVVAHPDGITTEYEPVTPKIPAGKTVRAGQAIAVITGTHHGCAPDRCLHWGARRGEVYLDPLRLLSPLGPVRLLPWDT
jgi:murein DD-endopeptidase MepM/ murein hydrolase activator NlpD